MGTPMAQPRAHVVLNLYWPDGILISTHTRMLYVGMLPSMKSGSAGDVVSKSPKIGSQALLPLWYAGGEGTGS
jgi:hypothetical protein